MFAKTVCKPGSFLTVVPVGLRTTLQYGSSGHLEKVFKGYDDDKTKLSDDLVHILTTNSIVPGSIPIKGGTSWVSGVLYTDTEFNDEGKLPYCVEDSIVNDIRNNPDTYSFYAGRVNSLAASFKAVLTIRNWLSMAKFKLLPGNIIPAGLTNDAFISMVNTPRYPFKFPYVSGYMIYEGINYKYHPLDMRQFVCTKVNKVVDENGYIFGTICSKEKVEMSVNYSEIIKHNILSATSVLLNADSKILATRPTDNKIRDNRTNILVCKTCGKSFRASLSGPVCCDDVHCRSKMYPDYLHFVDTLSLPRLELATYKKYIDAGEVICLNDIFNLPEYSDVQLTTSLSKVIQAVVPISVCPDPTLITMLCARCNDAVETVLYYLKNPLRMYTELNIQPASARRLVEWAEDPFNISLLESVLERNQITIEASDKKFDGAPIFRGRCLLVTGKFKHGNLDDVMSILRSYECKVVTDITSDMNAVLVGSLHENISGKFIQHAKQNNIPIFEEDSFFAQYGIDEDLADANLL